MEVEATPSEVTMEVEVTDDVKEPNVDPTKEVKTNEVEPKVTKGTKVSPKKVLVFAADHNHVLADIDESHIIKTLRERKTPQRFEPKLGAVKDAKETGAKGDKKQKTFKVMVIEAIEENANRKGSSSKAIFNYIYANYDVSEDYKTKTKRAIKSLVDDGSIVQKGTLYKKSKGKKSEKKDSPKKATTKKATPKKATPKKATPKKVTPKKVTPKKESPKKASPKTRSSQREKKIKLPFSMKEPEPKNPRNSNKAEKRVTKIKSVGGDTDLVSKKGALLKVTKPTIARTPTTSLELATTALQKSLPLVQLEMIFCFDTTGSMYDWLDKVREKIGEIVSRLLSDVRGIRIGIIAFGDYAQIKEEPYVIQIKDFSTDVDDIVAFVLSVDQTFGGDWEEAYELALRQARTEFSWTEGFSRALVMIGDATPHGKDDAVNKDKIDWEEELELLIKQQVKVYGVQCNTQNEKTTAFFDAISSKSGGSHLYLDQIEALGELLKGLAYREAAEVQFQAHAEEIKERISGLKRQTSAQLILPEEVNRENLFTNEQILLIHNAIHDEEKQTVEVEGVSHEIAVGTAGCRFVRIKEITFIQQNKEKDTKYARMSIEGHAITWICHEGRWGLIIDQDIVRK